MTPRCDRGSRSERRCDFRDDALRPLEHDLIPEPEHADADAVEVPRPLGVVRRPLRRVVDGPVDLDGETLGRAVEVQDLRPDAVLPPEPPAADVPVLEERPEPGLGGRSVRPEALPERRLARAVEEAAHRHRGRAVERTDPPFSRALAALAPRA